MTNYTCNRCGYATEFKPNSHVVSERFSELQHLLYNYVERYFEKLNDEDKRFTESLKDNILRTIMNAVPRKG